MSAGPTRGTRWVIALIVLAVGLRLATLAAYPLMDTTEARYAEIARKMVETGNWVTPQYAYGVPFWAKPPLSMWITALSFLLLGVNEFAARLPALVLCAGAGWLTFALAERRGGRRAALRTTLVLVSAPLFFVSAGAVMTDPALFLGTTLSFVGFWNAMTVPGRGGRAWGHLFFLGLAVGLLAKGPVAAVLTFAPVGVWTIWKGGIKPVWDRLPWVTGLALAAAVAVPWYVVAEARTPGFLEYFLVGEHWKRFTEPGWQGDLYGTAHVQARGTIWLFWLADTLPWWITWGIFALKARRSPSGASSQGDGGWRAYLALWALTPMVFFTMAGNILATYVLPGLPAFALLVSDAWGAAERASPRGTIGAGASFMVKLGGVLVPVILLPGMLFVLPRYVAQNSTRALVETYFAVRASPASRLVTPAPPPASAEFYTRGKLESVKSEAELEERLQAPGADFFLLDDDDLKPLGALRDRLEVVRRSGTQLLVRPRR